MKKCPSWPIAIASLLALLSLFSLSDLAVAQQQQPAGVVTGVQGQAQVTRPAAKPSPLRFRDGVIIRDVVDTREKSLARILFGGRSTVTVRELSRLQVTEEILPTGARRDVHDLASGAILVNVARQLMKPGDEVIIRTPNAVAAIRGSTVFGSFNPVLNQSFFAVLSGSGSVTPQGAPPITLTANTSNNGANVTGSGPAVQVTVINVPPAQANQIIAESQVAKVIKEEANKEQNVQAAAKEAAALVQAVVEAVTKTEQTTGETKTEEQKQEEQKQEQQEQASTSAEPTSETTTAPVTADTSSAADNPDVTVSNTSKTLQGDETLKTFSGSSSRSGESPVVKIENSTVDRASTGNLIQVNSGADAKLAGPLLQITNDESKSPAEKTTITGSQVLDVAGKLSSSFVATTEKPAFIFIDPTTIDAPNNFITIGSGGSLTLEQDLPLLTDVGGTFTAGSNFIAITGGGILTGNTTSVLLQFDNTSLTVGADGGETHFFQVTGSGSKASLKGPLLSAINSSSIDVKGSAFLEVFDSGQVDSTTTSPFVDLSGGSLTLGSNVHALLAGSTATANLSGGLLKATDATLTFDGGVPFIKVEGSSTFTLGGPLLDLSNSPLNLGSQSLVQVEGGSTFKNTSTSSVVKLSSGSLTASGLFSSSGATNKFELSGGLLDVSGTTLNISGNLGQMTGGTLTSTTKDPLIVLSNTELKASASGGTTNKTFQGTPSPSLSPTFGTLINFDDLATGVEVPSGNYSSKGLKSIKQIATVQGSVPPAKTFDSSQSDPNYVGTGPSFSWDGTFRFELANPTAKLGIGIADSAGVDTLILRDKDLNILTSATAPSGSNVYFGFERATADVVFLDVECDFCAIDDFQFNPASLGNLLRLENAVLDTGGTLFKASDSTFTLTSPMIILIDGSKLTAGGPFLDLTNVTLDAGSQPVARVEGGSTVKNTAGPVFKITGGSLTADALATTDGASNTFDLTGTLLDLTDTTVKLRVIGEESGEDNDSFTHTLAADEPIIKMTNSTLELTGTDTDDALIIIEEGAEAQNGVFKGLALIATDSTLTLPHGLLSMEGVFESTSTQPLVQLTDSTVTNTGDLIFVEKFGSDPTEVTLAGQLLKASGSTIKVKNEDVNTVTKTQSVGAKPFDVAFAGQRAYVVNFTAGTVSIINTRTNTLESTLTVGGFPTSIAREGSNIYVVNAGDDTVSRIDAISRTVTNTISVGDEPRDVAILPNNDKAYVTNFAGDTVSVIRTSDNTVIKTITVGDGPEGIDFSPDGKKIGVLNQNAGTVSIIDTSTDTVTATITVGTKPVDGAFTLKNDKAYVVNKDSDNVSVINVATNSKIKDISVGDGPDSIAITPNSKKAYVGNEFSDTVSVIDIETDTVTKTISVGDEPDSIAISPDGKRAYVTNFASNNVKVIDTESDTVIATINVGTGPGTIALTRGGTIAFVLNEDSNNTSIVDTIDVGNLLAISGGAILESTSTLPLLQFNPSTIELGGNLVSINGSGSKLELAGALVSGEDTKFDVRRILRVRDGGVLTSSTTGALMEFTGTAADKSKVTTLSELANIDQLDTTDKAPTVSLAGPFLKATKTTFSAGENSIDKSNLIIVADGALLKSTGTDPLITFDGSTLKPARGLLRIESPDSAGTGAKIEVAGPLLSVKNSSSFTTEADFISVRDKATLKGTGTTPLIQSSSSTFTIGSEVQDFGSFFRLDDNTTVTSNGGATVDLAGPLFQDTGSTFDIITRFLYVTGSSTLTSTSADPLMRFTDGTVDTDRNFVGVFDTSTLETKALLKATNTDFTAGTSDNDNSFLFVGSSSTLKGTGTDPFVIFETGSTLDTAGNFLTIRDSNSSTAPSTVSLAGPLLKATDGTFKTASCCSFLFIGEGGKLDGTGTGALFQLTDNTFDVGADFVTVADSSPTTAKVDIKGALVSDSGGTFTIGTRFLRVRDGSTLTSTSSDPLISLSGSTVSTKDDFIRIDDSGSKITLSGSLLSAGSTLNIGTDSTQSGDLLDINSGGQLVLTSTSSPVIEFTGGTHTIGTADSTTNNTPNRIVRLVGVNTSSTTGLGTDQPIKGPASTVLSGANNPIGTLLKATNAATIEVKKGSGDTSGGNAVRIDTALYEATLPVLDLIGSATTETTLKTASSTLDIFKSKVVANGPLVAMDKSFINVTDGPFIHVRNGSLVDVTGDLLKLFNGAKIEVINGPLIKVEGNAGGSFTATKSTLNVSGALAEFGGSGNNKIIVNNSIATTSTKSGIKVSETSSGTVSIGPNPIKENGVSKPLSSATLGSITQNGVVIQATNSGKVDIKAP